MAKNKPTNDSNQVNVIKKNDQKDIEKMEDKKIIEERIQKDCNVVEIAKELEQLFLINNSNPYQLLFEQIGKDGASKNAAKLIHQLLVLN